jgi:hypothetical protein
MTSYDQIKKKAASWRMISLLDGQKEALKPFNSMRVDAAKALKECDQIVQTLPNGDYYLAVKSAPSAKPQLFPFTIGAKDEPAPTQPTESAVSIDEYVRLKVKAKELEVENEILTANVQTYLQQIDDLEKEISSIEEAAQLAAEPTPPPIWETLLATAAPAILKKVGLGADDAPGQPGQPDTGTPSPIPGVTKTARTVYAFNPDDTAIPAQAMQQAQQAFNVWQNLPDSEREYLTLLTEVLKPFVSRLDDQVRSGRIKWQAAKPILRYLQFVENLDTSGISPDEAQYLQSLATMGANMLGGAAMKPAAQNIVNNYDQLRNWAK